MAKYNYGVYTAAYKELVANGKVSLNLGLKASPQAIKTIKRGISQEKYLDPDKDTSLKMESRQRIDTVTGYLFLTIYHKKVIKTTREFI
jgi:hypothetical protein